MQHQLSRLSIVVGFLAAVLLPWFSGCQPTSEIRSYQVPKETASAETPAESPQEGIESRMLVGFVPVEQSVWFLKLTGPKDQVEPHVSDFRAFLASLKFGEKGPSWDLPVGWQEQPGSGMRYATVNVGSAGLDISVISLPAPQDLLANVNRWRNQLQLAPISEQQLSEQVERIAASGFEATFIDLVGTMAAAPPGMPPFMAAPRSSPAPSERQIVAEASAAKSPADPGFTYEKPEAWKEGRLGPMRKLAFVVGEGEEQAEITVTTLASGGSAVLPNVNRWRAQLGLPEISADELTATIQQIEVGGTTSDYVELVGSEVGQPGQSTLAVITLRDDTGWFFKMMGASSVVAAEKPNFESFVKSVSFDVNP